MHGGVSICDYRWCGASCTSGGARLVKETDCAVTVGKEGQTADAAGVMSLMRLGIKKGDEVTVTADDPKVLEVLREFFYRNL